MKEPMLHLDLLTHQAHQAEVIAALKELQLVHIEWNDDSFRNPPEIQAQIDRLHKCQSLLKDVLDQYQGSSPSPQNHELDVEDLMALLEKRSGLLDLERKLKKESAFWNTWGAVDLQKVQALAKVGFSLRLFKGKTRELQAFDFAADSYVQVIHENDGMSWWVLIHPSEEDSLPFEEEKFPIRSATETAQLLEDTSLRLGRSEAEIMDVQQPESLLQQALIPLELALDQRRVEDQFQSLQEVPILHLSAWFPEKYKESVQQKLRVLPCSFSVREPFDGEKVPIWLKNKGYVRFFEPITKIFQLPSYFEFDLTPFIAVFYPILFAYCLGDAGYGAVLSLAALALGWFRKDWQNASLGLILGITTGIVGLIKSGSVFGIALSVDSSFVWAQKMANWVIIPDDTTFVWNAFNVALLIGLIQIFTGLFLSILKAIRFKGWLFSLSHFGKLFIIMGSVGLFLVNKAEIKEVTWSHAFQVALILGLILVAFFHDLSQAIVPRVAGSILPLFFIFTGLLGDVLSYVRLFALGVASAVLGLVVNQIGGQMWGSSWWMDGLALLFLLFGHGLNFALAALGSFVHPLRLTFVEFYNNAQFEGGGVAYKAFGQTTEENQ